MLSPTPELKAFLNDVAMSWINLKTAFKASN